MSTPEYFAPRIAATGEPVNLSMQRLWLTGQVLPAGARIVVRHVFCSEEDKPLEVIYAFPLPRDAALRSFRILAQGVEVHSELRETELAVQAYEEGISNGSLATLARQYGDGMVNLTVGNIRPGETVTVDLEMLCGVELRDDGFRFRFPFTLVPNYHARAKIAESATGELEMELPADEFGDIILPRFVADHNALHQIGFELTIACQTAIDEIGSPSHVVRIKRQDSEHSARVTLAAESDVPDRDLVLDAGYGAREPQVLAGRDRSGQGHFAAVVPSSSFGATAEEPRRVVILLDCSGSMQGLPLAQALRAIQACLGALSESDSFGLVSFSTVATAFQPKLVPGTRQWRDQANVFLMNVKANGGTELLNGFLQAAKLLESKGGEGKGGDILILTDGQVACTEKILEGARKSGVRLHCRGIGEASQDRFLALLARETGGVSRFVTPAERVDLPAVDLFASVGRPVASGLKAGDNIQPAAPSFVFRGTPVLLFGEAAGTEGEQIKLTWTGGQLNVPVLFNDGDSAETIRLLQGARLITDWESRYPSGVALGKLDTRTQSRVGARLLELSKTYGLASREMSLVAVVTRAGDRAGVLPEVTVVPLGMDEDEEDSFDLNTTGSMPTMYMSFAVPELAPRAKGRLDAQKAMASRRLAAPAKPTQSFYKPPPARSGGELIDLASQMDSDGGMPGNDADARALATIIALFAFLSGEHTAKSGAFRSHVTRLIDYLKSIKNITPDHLRIVASALQAAKKGRAPARDWLLLADSPGDHWSKVEESLARM